MRMANQLKMAESNAVTTLFQQGWSKRKIARELALDRATVSRHIRQLLQQPVPGGAAPPLAPRPVSAPASASNAATPDEVATGSAGVIEPGSASRSKCGPFVALIETKLEAGLSAQRIFEDLKTEHCFEGAYNSVKRMVRLLTIESALPFRRMESEPGAEAQCDFGTGVPLLDPEGKRRRTHVQRLFLSYSRKAYSEVVFRQTTENLLACWENAFWYWGGVPKTLVIDHLKAAVLQPDWYDPELQPKMDSFCQHYGTVLLPTKPRTPRHKGKIESGIKYVQENALKGRTFNTLLAQNE